MVAWKQHCITREQSLWTAYEDALNKTAFYLFLQTRLYPAASFCPNGPSYGITAPVISDSMQNYFNDNFGHCKILCLTATEDSEVVDQTAMSNLFVGQNSLVNWYFSS